jgi:hypothetical protein
MLRLPSSHPPCCVHSHSRALPSSLGRAAAASLRPLLQRGAHDSSRARQHRHITTHAKSADSDDGDDDDDGPAAPGRSLRVERLLANLGYGRRKECQTMVKRGVVRRLDGSKVRIGDKVQPGDVLVDGEPVDDPFPLIIVVNKPVGYVVTSADDERVLDPTVYDLLPHRLVRQPTGCCFECQPGVHCPRWHTTAAL